MEPTASPFNVNCRKSFNSRPRSFPSRVRPRSYVRHRASPIDGALMVRETEPRPEV